MASLSFLSSMSHCMLLWGYRSSGRRSGSASIPPPTEKKSGTWAKGIVKPERLRHIRKTVPGNGPVRNVVVDLFRPHVVDVLGIVCPVFRLTGTGKLVGLKNDVADAPLPYPGIFSAPGMDRFITTLPLPSSRFLPLRLLRTGSDAPAAPVGISHCPFLLRC